MQEHGGRTPSRRRTTSSAVNAANSANAASRTAVVATSATRKQPSTNSTQRTEGIAQMGAPSFRACTNQSGPARIFCTPAKTKTTPTTDAHHHAKENMLRITGLFLRQQLCLCKTPLLHRPSRWCAGGLRGQAQTSGPPLRSPIELSNQSSQWSLEARAFRLPTLSTAVRRTCLRRPLGVLWQSANTRRLVRWKECLRKIVFLRQLPASCEIANQERIQPVVDLAKQKRTNRW